jgi:hypothetical protein
MVTIRMPVYDGIYDATLAALAAIYVEADNFPSQMHDKLDTYVGEDFGMSSPVDIICNFTESVYANRPALVSGSPVTTGMMEVAAGCADVIDQNNFWDSLSGRAVGIRDALRRDAGETADPSTPWPDPSTDPAPAEGYGPPS